MEEGFIDPHLLKKIKLILGICLLAGILIYLFSTRSEEISVAIKDDHMSLSYSSGDSFDIKYRDILSVTEIQDLDLGKYVSGIETKRYKFGVWDNDEFGEYNLCIYANVVHYIVVETSDGVFVLNFESEDATDSFYKAFLKLLQTKRAETAP